MESSQIHSRIKWTVDQLNLLKQLAREFKGKKWTKIAKKLNKFYPQNMRTSKQCREKYVNHLQFEENQISLDWNQQQIQILFNEYRQKGPKWRLISFSLPSKSENSIKNKFYGTIRKYTKKLNIIASEQLKNGARSLSQKSIIRIINFNDCLCGLPAEICDQSRQLKKKIFKILKSGLQDYETWEKPQKQALIKLIQSIYEFNSKSRYICTKNGKITKCLKNYGFNSQQQRALSQSDTAGKSGQKQGTQFAVKILQQESW